MVSNPLSLSFVQTLFQKSTSLWQIRPTPPNGCPPSLIRAASPSNLPTTAVTVCGLSLCSAWWAGWWASTRPQPPFRPRPLRQLPTLLRLPSPLPIRYLHPAPAWAAPSTRASLTPSTRQLPPTPAPAQTSSLSLAQTSPPQCAPRYSTPLRHTPTTRPVAPASLCQWSPTTCFPNSRARSACWPPTRSPFRRKRGSSPPWHRCPPSRPLPPKLVLRT